MPVKNALILPPPAAGALANGSLGDQAMLDVVGSHVREQWGMVPRLVSQTSGARTVALRAAHDVAVIEGMRAKRILQAASLVWSADAVIYLGADVIDGAYNPRNSYRKIQILGFSQKLGKSVLIAGCSWSNSPNEFIVKTLKKYADVPIIARDPVSRERLESDLGRNVPLVADLAFLLEPAVTTSAAEAAFDWAATRRRNGVNIVAVNVSGHAFAQVGQPGLAAAALGLRAWLEKRPDRGLLLIPHDGRPYPTGDVEALDCMHASLADFGPDRLHVLRFPFNAWDAKAVVGGVDAVITGRMHLAVAALGMGKPTACVVRQGKFEGLMQHFGLEDEGLMMEPSDFFGDASMSSRLLDRLLKGREQISDRIAARLPSVVELAQKNFDFLSGDRAAAASG